MISVMITGCSMHSYDLIRELRNNYENEEVRVVGINCSENALLRKGVDAGYIVPRIEDDKYWEEMIRISKEEKIDVIFPFITAELPLISRRKEWIENETGAKVSVSSLESLEAVGNKITLSQKYGSLMPRQAVATSVSDIDKFIDDIRYDDGNHDFCIKLPDRCGGLGFAIVDERLGRDLTIYNKFGINRYITKNILFELLKDFDFANDRIILQEYEEGTDYSLCVLCDKGELLYSLGFAAPVMSYGSAMYAEICKNDNAEEIAKQIVEESGLDGNACFDFILKPDGSLKLLEVNPRLSATLPFIARAGLNLPYLRCKQLLGEDIKKYDIKVNYNLRMSKNYESEYFV